MIIRILFIAIFFLSGCSKAPLKESSRDKPLVLVSIAPYQGFLERIAGDLLEVATIVPQGTSAHTFEPNARQIAEMGRAVVWFRIGEPFEGKILPLLQERNQKLSVLDLRDGVELIESEDLHAHSCSRDHQDRHIWMSPKLASQQATAMGRFLMEKFPDHQETFQRNVEGLVQDLSSLDAEIQTLLHTVKNRVILVSHPAFGYFCRDYDCLQLSVESEGKDPRPRYLEELVHMAEQKASMAIAIPQYNNRGAQRIAETLHLPIQVIDPYSSDYFQMMRRLAAWVADPHHLEP